MTLAPDIDNGAVPLFLPCLLPPVEHYLALDGCTTAAYDVQAPYQKRQKAMHRFAIADVRGRLEITVPVSAAPVHGRRRLWADMVVSAHGGWWHTVDATLHTAYDNAPYFDDLYPLFAPLFSEASVGSPITDINLGADAIVRRLLGMGTRLSATPVLKGGNPMPLQPVVKMPAVPQYRQVRQQSLGFVPGLSILDYLMNCGTAWPPQPAGTPF